VLILIALLNLIHILNTVQIEHILFYCFIYYILYYMQGTILKFSG